MARETQDPEDLLAEATALVERVELVIAGSCGPITAGFRADGSLSIYIGSDPVYQFNAAGELRRAFVDGLMIKAVKGRLAWLARHRLADRVELVRHDLTPGETAQFVRKAHDHLTALRDALAAGHFQLRGQVPAERDVVKRVGQWLEQLPSDMRIALSPHVR